MLRKTLSVWANRFLAFAVKGDIVTLTGMVRVYDDKFLRSLNLRSTGMEINPEAIHKTMLLNARIAEIPAHLHSRSPTKRQATRQKRQSSMKILRHTMAVILSGFIFRPVMFFLIPGLILLLCSLYANVWVLIHCWGQYQIFAQSTFFPDLTEVVAAAFYQAPHAFIIGGMSLIIAIQFLITDMGALTPIIYQGAIPVFADVDPRTWNVTADTIAARISDRTKGIIVTHLFGNPCNMSEITELAQAHNIPVIEDSAQALLATHNGQNIGVIGDIGCFSLHV